MIPCEFCGIQLEEEILFHHQVLNRTGSVGSHPIAQGWAQSQGVLVAHFRNSGSCPWLRLYHTKLWGFATCEGFGFFFPLGFCHM